MWYSPCSLPSNKSELLSLGRLLLWFGGKQAAINASSRHWCPFYHRCSMSSAKQTGDCALRMNPVAENGGLLGGEGGGGV